MYFAVVRIYVTMFYGKNKNIEKNINLNFIKTRAASEAQLINFFVLYHGCTNNQKKKKKPRTFLCFWIWYISSSHAKEWENKLQCENVWTFEISEYFCSYFL